MYLAPSYFVRRRTECLSGGCDGISCVNDLGHSSTERAMAGCMISPLCSDSWNPQQDDISAVSEYTNSWNLRKILWDPGYWVRAAMLLAQSQALSVRPRSCFEALILLAGLILLADLGLHVSGSWVQGDGVFDHRLDRNKLEPVACV